MVCSERELGLSDEHEGILVLDDAAAVGTHLREVLGETVLDIAPTPNRPDHFSVLGIAREVAALTGQSVREPAIDYAQDGPADHAGDVGGDRRPRPLRPLRPRRSSAASRSGPHPTGSSNASSRPGSGRSTTSST